MNRLGINAAALRSGLASGLPAAALAWIVFIGRGGSRGMTHQGTMLPMVVFVVEILLYGYAGFRLRRAGNDRRTAMAGGLIAGWTAALLAEFPRGAILLLNHGYMRYLQGALPHAGNLSLPWLPFTVAAALIGALLAGSALGAACGSIGASCADAWSLPVPTQLP